MPKTNPIINNYDLLKDLNEIADFVIGNNSLGDYGYKGIDTLPEAIAFAMARPSDLNGLHAAKARVKTLLKKVTDMENKLRIMIRSIEIKREI